MKHLHCIKIENIEQHQSLCAFVQQIMLAQPEPKDQSTYWKIELLKEFFSNKSKVKTWFFDKPYTIKCRQAIIFAICELDYFFEIGYNPIYEKFWLQLNETK